MISQFMKVIKDRRMFSNMKEEEYQHMEKMVSRRMNNIQEQYSRRKSEMIKHALAYMGDLFSKVRCLIAADDSDKLSPENFRIFITNLESMPKNVVFISTAHSNQLREGLIPQVQKMYDHYLVVEPISNAEELSKYVNGRILNYSKGSSKLLIGRPVFEVLFERTKGNLRETFRYLRTLFHFISLEQWEYPELTDTHIKNIIREEDSAVLKSLKPLDKAILDALSQKNEMNITEITSKVNSMNHKQYAEHEIRKRLDYLYKISFVFKKQVDANQHKLVYLTPKILSEVLIKKI